MEHQTVKLDGQFRVLTKEYYDFLKYVYENNELKTEALKLVQEALDHCTVEDFKMGALIHIMEKLEMPIKWHHTTRNFERDFQSYFKDKLKE